jgi:hypothetical protein
MFKRYWAGTYTLTVCICTHRGRIGPDMYRRGRMNWENDCIESCGFHTFPVGTDAEAAWCKEVYGLSKQTSTFFDPKRRNRVLHLKEPGPFKLT